MGADDVSALARALDETAPDAALALLGEPTQRTRQQWRWGRRGSLALEITGPKRGRWCDHETGEGGDMLQLARRQHYGDLRAAIDWARGFLRMPQERTGKPAGESKPVSAPHRPASA